MHHSIKHILCRPVLILLLLLAGSGCSKELEIDKYERPEWLSGKVYTQVLMQPELSVFAKCIELTGYDEIINTSGIYTVFAPTNEAFDLYFQEHPLYGKPEDIPIPDLTEIVKYHLIKNPWSKTQLRSFDYTGWIDTLSSTNNEPRGFKHESLLRDENQKVGVMAIGQNMMLTDTLDSDWHRVVLTEARKYAPVFYQEYFDIYGLNYADYGFYFGREFPGASEICFAEARIISDEIFAENGFVYEIDRVVEPRKNGQQFLTEKGQANSYDDFWELISFFPDFAYNETRTNDQEGASEGLEVDSLFNMSFPDLTFNPSSEKTASPEGYTSDIYNLTVRYHHGLTAPTNNALNAFVNEYLNIPNGWGSLANTPRNIKQIIVNTHMSNASIYPTDFNSGFYNGESDLVTIDQSAIIQKEFGSNCTFIGLDRAIVPRAFSSVAGPVYLQRGYSTAMFAIEEAEIQATLKRSGQNYMFLVESDADLKLDSSLLYDSHSNRFSAINQSDRRTKRFDKSDLTTLLLNHIGLVQPKKSARREFIPNMAGNYIVVDNQTGEISGPSETTFGYMGYLSDPEFPTIISNNPDNGVTYGINNWLSFDVVDMYGQIRANYPGFHALLVKAGLAEEQLYRYNFLSDSEFYTVFVPSDAALNTIPVDAMSVEELVNFLMLHFIQGEVIFTDGTREAGYYESLRVSKASTEFTTVYTQVYIDPLIDIIRIPGADGTPYLDVEESETSNQMVGVIAEAPGETAPSFPVSTTNGVIHQIDKVLLVDEIKTR